MSFVSFQFIIFAGLSILLYYAFPRKARWTVLLAASVFFYCMWDWRGLPFLLAAAAVAYCGAGLIVRVYRGGRHRQPKRKARRILDVSVTVLVILMLYARVGEKIAGLIAGISEDGTVSAIQAMTVLGVSYYTLSLIAYLADVYWKKQEPEKNFLRLLLFTIWFPKILQGPIARYRSFGVQLKTEHTFDFERFCRGLQLMLWGYFKKMVIADRLALLIGPVLGNIAGQAGSVLLLTFILSSLQLYCDFSGCMDIAAGFCQCLGLTLERNFDRPFFSGSAAEFWRRWHITLGTWLRDYIYMPLAISPRLISLSKHIREKLGNRTGKAVMTIIPLLAVWLLSGLWHGTGWNYVVWGLYWGTVIILTTVFAPEIGKLTQFLHINTQSVAWKVFRAVRTFMLFTIGRILTVPGDLAVSGTVFQRIFTCFEPWKLVDGTISGMGTEPADIIVAVAALLILWFVSVRENRGSVREQISKKNTAVRWAVWYALVFAVILFGIYGVGYNAGMFIYMQY